jgi:probable H4MPT-linked C1 transfer pathway protein
LAISRSVHSVIGWDIGGVNTKAALVIEGVVQAVITRSFELQKDPDALPHLLADIAHTLTRDAPQAHAITMTAELSQMFLTKPDGVRFVLDAVERAFAGACVRVYTTSGTFVDTDAARAEPLHVAAANWFATAALVARDHPEALLIDVGTTTTDVIPIASGRVVASGRTDPERLTSGELVYTGVVRTPADAIVRTVPLDGQQARVSAEGFALAGDAHVWLGVLAAGDYDAATPDGRPATREFAGLRLARMVCGDREMLDDTAITAIASAVAEAQLENIGAAVRQVVARHPAITTAVVSGLGAFVGARAAAAAGLRVTSLSEHLGASGSRSAPATAVGLLLEQQLRLGAPAQPSRGERDGRSRERTQPAANPLSPPLTVVKLGGSLLAEPSQWHAALATLAASASSRRIVVVPGGGPFANAVRDIDNRYRLQDDAAHWMAITGMDQHAEMIAASRDAFVRVADIAGIDAAHRAGRVAVLAPLQWMRAADPLPHTWEITSDSIAAWVAGEVNASELLLIKPAGANGPALVDGQFDRTRPADLPWAACDAWDLQAQLSNARPARR